MIKTSVYESLAFHEFLAQIPKMIQFYHPNRLNLWIFFGDLPLSETDIGYGQLSPKKETIVFQPSISRDGRCMDIVDSLDMLFPL